MIAEVNITSFREQLSETYSTAVQGHRPQFIERNGRDRSLLLGQEEVWRLLEGYEFHPEVFKEGDLVSVWLPELEIYGRGEDFAAALHDLAEEAREYAEEYMADAVEYLQAPNRAHHFSHVLKVLIADQREELISVLTSEPCVPVRA